MVTSFNKATGIHGNRVPHGKRAHAIAEYLVEVQWKEGEDTGSKTMEELYKIIEPIWEEGFEELDNEITIEEIKKAIHLMKNNKAPGPDLCIIE